MKIYTSGCGGKKLDEIARLDMGILATPPEPLRTNWKEFSVALDNGAFSCWMRGLPFMAENFLNHIKSAHKSGCTIDFIVCPDIVAGGLRSLDFSLDWANSKHLISSSNLYLAVQDGMEPKHITPNIYKRFAGIFIGGTVEWKWKTAAEWVSFAHGLGKKCHIGRCGKIESLHRAREIGADSVDSSNFARNDSFKTVERFETEGVLALN